MGLKSKILDSVSNRIIKKMKPEIDRIVSEKIKESSHDLKLAMQQIASQETANFIIDKLPIHLSFDDRYSLLTRACEIIKEANKDQGVILEFGVYRGSTINHMSDILPKTKFFGFDSFEGLLEPWIYNDVRAFNDVENLPEVNSNVSLVKGYFDATLPGFVKNLEGNVTMLHIDCDLYSSTKTVFENLKTYITPGLIIVFDEFFNYPGWQQGEYKAWNELVNEMGLKYEYIGYTYQRTQKHKSGNQLAIIIK